MENKIKIWNKLVSMPVNAQSYSELDPESTSVPYEKIKKMVQTWYGMQRDNSNIIP